MDDEVSIKVIIADRAYPLKVSINEEERIRNAAKLINERIRQYKQEFDVQEKQTLLAMCSLQLASELLECKDQSSKLTDQLNQEIFSINETLNDYLGS